MEIVVKFVAFLILCAIASAVGEVFFQVMRSFEKRLHPEQCPLCKMDIEHLDTCFGCPFVVVDEWEECEDCCYKAPRSGHCGLKDKEFLQRLEGKHTDRLI